MENQSVGRARHPGADIEGRRYRGQIGAATNIILTRSAKWSSLKARSEGRTLALVATAHSSASDCAGELDQYVVADQLNNAAMVLGDYRVDELGAMCLKGR